MALSSTHESLVQLIKNHILNTYPEIEIGEMFIDGIDKNSPSMPDGHKPDLYCKSKGHVIIGEAKTETDLYNEHTKKQFISYLKWCEIVEKEDLTPLIIYAVPSYHIRKFDGYLHEICKEVKIDSIPFEVRTPMGQINSVQNGTPNGKVIFRNEKPIITKIQAYDYQIRALNFLKNLEYSAVFHEQGLGKTKIAIDLLVDWIKNDVLDTVLIITKKTLVDNWKNEIIKHTNITPAIINTSTKNNYYAFVQPHRILISNFEAVKKEFNRFKKFQQCLRLGAIIDESTKIKNPESSITKTLFKLSDGFVRKTIMTGTPIANRPYDIWAQIYFLDKGASLGTDFKEFQMKTDMTNKLCGDQIKQKEFEKNIMAIFDKISDFSIRETKNSGIINLPKKEYYTIEVPFEPHQKQIYDQIRQQTQCEIIKDGELITDDSSVIIKRLTRLIEVTSNPGLIDESYDDTPEKLKIVKELVAEIHTRGEKVIVWTSFLDNIKLIKENLREYTPVTFSGAMDDEERNQSIDQFLNNSNVCVLIATYAAKEGLTLTVANNAIYYDRTLSLDDYLQSQDRIHRISQNKICNIYNITVKESIDEWVDKLICSKELAAKLIQKDITVEEYNNLMDYTYGDIIKEILKE